MPSIIGEALVRVRPDTRTFGRDAERGVRSGLGRITRLAGIGAGAGVGVVIANEIRKSVGAAKEAQVIQAQLAGAVEATGNEYRAYAAEIDNVLQAQSRLSSFDDEELAQSFTNIVRRVGDVNRALELNALAANVARGRGIGLTQAAQLIVRAYNGQITSLRRLGLEVTKTTTREQALDLLRRKYANAASIYAGTAEGAQARLNKTMDDTREIIGGALLPSISTLSTRVADYLDEANRTGEVQDRVNRVMDVGGDIAEGLASAFERIRQVTGPLIEGVGGVENAIQLAIGAKLALTAVRAVGSIVAIGTAFTAMSRKVIADSVTMGAAIDLATRPRVVPIAIAPGGLPTGLPRGAGGAGGAAAAGGALARLGALANPALAIGAVIGTVAVFQRGKREAAKKKQEAEWAAMSPAAQRSFIRDNPKVYEALQSVAGVELPLKPIVVKPGAGAALSPDSSVRAPGPPAPEPTAASTGVTGGASRLQTLRLRQAQAERDDDLVTQRAIQREVVAMFQARLDNTKLTGQARVRFAEELSAEQDRLDGIEDRISADAAQKAAQRATDRQRDAQRAKDAVAAADQKFIDALARGRRPTERRIERRAGDEDATNDVAPLVALQNRIEAEIRATRKGVQNAATRTAELDRLGDELVAVNDRLKQARRDRNAAIAATREEKQETITETLDKRITLADLQGNQQAELRAYDAAIADAKRRVKRAQDLGKGVLDEKIKLAQLRANRKAAVEEAKKDKADAKGPGTNLVDFLREGRRINSLGGDFIPSGGVAPPDVTAPIAARVSLIAAAQAGDGGRVQNEQLTTLRQIEELLRRGAASTVNVQVPVQNANTPRRMAVARAARFQREQAGNL